eukprot:gene26732-33356_t
MQSVQAAVTAKSYGGKTISAGNLATQNFLVLEELQALQIASREAHDLLSDHDNHLRGVDAHFLWIDEQLDLKASKMDLLTLANEVDEHDNQLRLRATVKTVDELERQLKLAQEQLREAEETLVSNGTALIDIRGTLSTRASVQDVRSCVTRIHHDEAMMAFGKDLDRKAPVTVAEQLLEQVQTLEARVEQESERTSVAVHFVDWFMARGENYEANMQIIDRHLQKLTKPEVRGIPRPQ